MIALALKRLALGVVTLIGITFLVFSMITLAPGGAVPSWVSADPSAAGVVKRGLINDRLGLDDPLLVQYGRWLARVSPVNFGERPLVDPATGATVPPIRDLAFDREFRTGAVHVPDLNEVDAERTYRQARRTLYESREAYLSTGAQRYATTWLAARERIEKVTPMLNWERAGVSVIPGALWLDWPDLGVSWARSRPISTLLGEALPITLGINALALVIIVLLAVPLGVWSATKAGKKEDRAISGTLLALWSLPLVWVATLAVTTLTTGDGTKLFPLGGLHSPGAEDMPFLPSAAGPGYALDTLWHVALPVLCLVVTGLAMLARQTRSAVLAQLRERHVATARAKGVPEGRVVTEHALRSALAPIITLVTGMIAALFAGSVVVETVFSIPGIGLLTLEAINLRDRELMLALTLVVSVVNLAMIVVADLLYMLADPRVRIGGAP